MGRVCRQCRSPEHSGKRRLLFGAIMAALMAAPVTAIAQSGYPLTPAESGIGRWTPAAPELRSLRGGFRELGVDGVARVIGGTATSHAAWKSFVLLRSQAQPGR